MADLTDDLIKINLVILRNQFFIMGALIANTKRGNRSKIKKNLLLACTTSGRQLVEWRLKHNVDINSLEKDDDWGRGDRTDVPLRRGG